MRLKMRRIHLGIFGVLLIASFTYTPVSACDCELTNAVYLLISITSCTIEQGYTITKTLYQALLIIYQTYCNQVNA